MSYTYSLTDGVPTGVIQSTINEDNYDIQNDSSIDLKELTTPEIEQLQNIDLNEIINNQWGYLAALDQSLATTDDAAFNSVDVGGNVLLSTLGSFIGPNTSSGSDNFSSYLSGSRAVDINRGPIVGVHGNQFGTTSFAGTLLLAAGNSASATGLLGGGITFSVAGNFDYDDMVLTRDGNLLLNTASDDGTNRLQVNGSGKLTTLTLTSLPTSDPTTAGMLWNDAGTVKISAG